MSSFDKNIKCFSRNIAETTHETTQSYNKICDTSGNQDGTFSIWHASSVLAIKLSCYAENNNNNNKNIVHESFLRSTSRFSCHANYIDLLVARQATTWRQHRSGNFAIGRLGRLSKCRDNWLCLCYFVRRWRRAKGHHSLGSRHFRQMEFTRYIMLFLKRGHTF